MSSSGEKREEEDPIHLKIKSQNMKTVWMGIKLDCQMHKLMTTYCQRKNLEPQAPQFLYGDGGVRVHNRDTPRKLGLKSGDEILVMMHQHGGGLHSE